MFPYRTYFKLGRVTSVVLALVVAVLPLRARHKFVLPSRFTPRSAAVYAQVQFLVTNEAGKPVSKPHFRFLGERDKHPQLHQLGALRFRYSRNEHIWALVSASGYGKELVTLPQTAGVRELKVNLAHARTVSGRVLDDRGEVVTRAIVQLDVTDLPALDAALFKTTTDTNGNFRFTDVGSANYRLTGSAASHETADRTLSRDHLTDLRLVLRRFGTLEGEVTLTDDSDAKSLNVWIGGGELWPARKAEVHDKTHFIFRDLPSGVYEVQARARSASSAVLRGVTIASGERRSTKLNLEKGLNWSGKIVDASNKKPLRDVQVLLSESALSLLPYMTKTQNTGQFSFEGLRAGQYQLRVIARGFLQYSAALQIPSKYVTTVALERSATLRGVVQGEDGKPIVGATLEVIGQDASDRTLRLQGPSTPLPKRNAQEDLPPLSIDSLGVTQGSIPPIPRAQNVTVESFYDRTVTDTAPWISGAHGEFELQGLPAGTLAVHARHTQHVLAESAPVTLRAGETISGIKVKLSRGGKLIGQVVDREHHAVSDVLLKVTTGSMGEVITAVTDRDGHFTVEPLLGKVHVQALPFELESVDADVEVKAQQSAALMLTIPSSLHRTEGIVVDSRGEPIDNAQVTIRPLQNRLAIARSALTDQEGHFALQSLAAPPYAVEVRSPGYAVVQRTYAPSPNAPPLRIALRSGATINVRVIDAMNRDPVSNAHYALSLGEGLSRSGVGSKTGEVRIGDVEPGAYSIRLSSPLHATRTVDFRVANEQEQIELPTIELRRAGSIRGTVVDSLGRPVASAKVTDARGNGATTDQKGEFHVTGVEPGIWDVQASHPQAGQARLQGVRVRQDEETVGVVLHLPKRAD